jgi:hypothetical protein
MTPALRLASGLLVLLALAGVATAQPTGRVKELIDGRVTITNSKGQKTVDGKDIRKTYALVDPDTLGLPGNAGEFELGIEAGLAATAGSTQYGDAQMRLQLSAGYLVIEELELGVETGVMTSFDTDTPVLIDVAAAVTAQFGGDIRFFAKALGGVQVASFGDGVGAGPLAGGGLGVKFALSRRSAFLLGATYTWSQQSLDVSNLTFAGQPTVSVDLESHRVLVDAGFLVYF